MIALLKFSPIFLLSGLMMISNIEPLSLFFGFSLDITIVSAIATIYAAIIAVIVQKLKFNEVIDSALDNVKDINIVLFILMFAYAMAEAFMSTGVGASIVNVSLKIGISARMVAPVAFLVTSVLSVATGTSWGTFAAGAPIFLWLSHILGADMAITLAAIAGGACFGDNIGLISDTTVVSSGIQNVSITDRIRHQGVWSILCLVLAFVALVFVSRNLPSVTANGNEVISQIPLEVWDVLEVERPAAVDLLRQIETGVPFYMILPLILVLIAAIAGVPTIAALLIGLVSSCVFGMFAGTVPSLVSFLNLVLSGFVDAGSWVILVGLWIAAFGGIMIKMNAFDPIIRFFVGISSSVRQLMFWNGALCLLGTAALADDMPQIVTIGPIIKKITEENVVGSKEDMYTLALRNATFSDAMSVFGSQLVPWHTYLAFYIGISNSVFPLYQFKVLDIIKYNFMAWFAVISIFVLTLTGWDRFIPLFKTPGEPEVNLKKNLKTEIEDAV